VSLKVASFTVHATVAQSARWKQAAEAEGFRSAGAWLAEAADAYLKARARTGNPIPLAWRRGLFSVRLDSGEVVNVRGHASSPFGAFPGTGAGQARYPGKHRYALVYVPESRIIATLRSFRQCKALASEMAPALLRGDVAEIVERHRRESF
jgi:hypothetical protein